MHPVIYFDHAATTPVDERVLEAMIPYFSQDYGNPSSVYQFAQRGRRAIDAARDTVASIFACSPRDILFTSGGTESNNLFLFGVALYARDARLPYRHIITTKIEHDSVLKPLEYLASIGFEISYLEVGERGIVKASDVEKALRPDTLCISIMYANNEIGTIQPIREIAEVIKKHRTGGSPYPLLHTDACQAAGYLDLSVKNLGVDAMTVNAGKIYGPKGTGALYIKEGTSFVPLAHGGGQEYRKRAGTENVPGIVGFAKALQLVQAEKAAETARLMPLRDRLISSIVRLPDTRLNGDRENRLPNNVNVSFRGLEGEAILLQLDMLGIAASAGSACTSGSLEPSHVILALGLTDEWSHSSTRFTLGHSTSDTQIDFLIEKLPRLLEQLRETSPFV